MNHTCFLELWDGHDESARLIWDGYLFVQVVFFSIFPRIVLNRLIWILEISTITGTTNCQDFSMLSTMLQRIQWLRNSQRRIGETTVNYETVGSWSLQRLNVISRRKYHITCDVEPLCQSGCMKQCRTPLKIQQPSANSQVSMHMLDTCGWHASPPSKLWSLLGSGWLLTI